jgi:hypothetical protein
MGLLVLLRIRLLMMLLRRLMRLLMLRLLMMLRRRLKRLLRLPGRLRWSEQCTAKLAVTRVSGIHAAAPTANRLPSRLRHRCRLVLRRCSGAWLSHARRRRRHAAHRGLHRRLHGSLVMRHLLWHRSRCCDPGMHRAGSASLVLRRSAEASAAAYTKAVRRRIACSASRTDLFGVCRHCGRSRCEIELWSRWT